MRIITGKAKGLKLITPKNSDVRPTSDRVKESLFSIIGSKICGAVVLDLFAGTGNLGLEAWSRGAEKITFVDESRASLKIIQGNTVKARAENDAVIINACVLKAIAQLESKGKSFDFVFCDPPYDKGWPEKVIRQFLKHRIVKAGGYLVLEYSAREKLPTLPSEVTEVRTEKYGDTRVSFLNWQ